MKIITLTTDFGLKDAYLGAMKGAILSVNPYAVITDVSHLIKAGNILDGSLAMLSACHYFPDGTIHVGVVDPGVGTARAPLLIETDRFFFIGPDNGLLIPAARSAKIRRITKITNKKYFRGEVSRTFHGRDIFGPVAAHLSLGISLDEFGVNLRTRPKEPDVPKRTKRSGVIKGQVVHVDTYGNLITNIPAADLQKAAVRIEFAGRVIKGLKSTYGDAKQGELIAVIGSSGLLEIAANMASAAEKTEAGCGQAVTIKPAK